MSLSDIHTEQEKAFLEAFNIPFPYVPPEPKFAEKIDPRKILVLADPHEPFSLQRVYDNALANHHDAAMVVIPGDLGDYYSKSRFKKTHYVSFRDEVEAIFHRMEWLSAHWPQVKIMLGNHDNRPEKAIQSLLQVDVELLILTEARLLHHMAAYFPNIEVVQHQIVNTGCGLTFLWPYGDILFAHVQISRTQASATTEYIDHWLYDWDGVFKLPKYRLLLQAHNHQSDKRDIDGRTLMLAPTASDIYSVAMEYARGPKPMKLPPATGYTVLYHDEGRVSTNECHNIILRS